MKYIIYIFLISNIQFINAQLLKPIQGSVLNYTHVLFEWEQINDADCYQFQLSSDENFSNILVDLIDSSLIYIETNEIDWTSTYYWRLKPVKNNDFTQDWIGENSFTTGSSISNISAQIFNSNQYNDGVTIFGAFFNYFSSAFDKNGNEIWNTGDNNFVFYNTDYNGKLFGCELRPELEYNIPGIEFTLDNNIIWEESNDNFTHHDIIQLPNGNYLGIIETTQSGPVPIGDWSSYCYSVYGALCDGVTSFFPWHGDKIVEWDAETKEIIWEWNTFDHLDMSDYDELGGSWIQGLQQGFYDWTHTNALFFDETENAIYISIRHLSRIIKIDYPSGNIIWSMGLNMSSNDVDFGHDILFSWQHSIQVLENGNIVILDNGNLSQQLLNTDYATTRALEIEIIESNNIYSSNVVWEYNLPDYLFGFASGNVQKLENNNYLITTVGEGGTVLEVNSNKEIVWQGNLGLTLPNGAVYRANRINGLYPIEFSIIAPKFEIINSNKIIELSEGENEIQFSIINEGQKTETFEYSFNDSESYFNPIYNEITLEPNSKIDVLINGNINSNLSSTLNFTVTPSSRQDLEKSMVLTTETTDLNVHKNYININDFSISNPYPNPYNPVTNFDINIEKYSYIDLSIYNILGERIITLYKGFLNPGKHPFQIKDYNLSSGEYLIRLQTNNHTITKKISLIK